MCGTFQFKVILTFIY